MQILAVKKIVLTSFFLMVFVAPVLFLSAKADAAARRSDCNGDFIYDADKCKKAFDNCADSDDPGGCKADVINKFTIEGAGQKGNYQCGNLDDQSRNVKTKFNFGCLGKNGPANLGPIQDLVFALIRFASVGIGIVITVSLILAGLQYSMAEGNPENSQSAKQRAQYAVIGLAIYIFAFSILQYLIPGGLFKT